MNVSGTSYESSLLLTLGEITQLVVHSHDVAQTLDNIVRLIQGRFHTDVCSVYCVEQDTGDLVLGATVGLKSEAVGRVRMAPSEGLTGLVGEQLAPVMVADAFRHPRFKYFPEAGEDKYHSFLGVPLLQGGTLQGVLVVQTTEQRTFSQGEIRTLVTVAAQLAPLVRDARWLQQLGIIVHQGDTPPPSLSDCGSELCGVPLSAGVGMGYAYVVDGFDEWRKTIPLRIASVIAGLAPDVNEVTHERHRLAKAVLAAREELTRLSRHISELVGEDHGAILQAQLMIMQDRTIEKDLEAGLAAGATAEGVLFSTLDQYVAAFQKVSAPYFQERVFDIKDVFHRLLWQLRPKQSHSSRDLGDKVILIAKEASVMELFAVDVERLAGVVVEHGGVQSHAAILAKSLGIPMVGQVKDFSLLMKPGRRLLIDGNKGTLTVEPGSNVIVPASPITTPYPSPPVELPAGLPRVEVNINLLYEARPAVRLGVSGVGLYRSEFLFLARRSLPTEDEQMTIYRKLLHTLGGRPVCIRTFDLRPDKLASYSHLGSAATRPYDWRRVLVSPQLQQLFREQVRAILRAATDGPVKILVPFVGSQEVLDFVLETVGKARDDLNREGLAFSSRVPVGVMLETAAAAPFVSSWAEQIDFFALGTNDLAASALGLDRDDPIAAGLIDPLHPGLLRLIASILSDARKARRPVSVCGEMASDPLGAIVLAAFQADSLSVAVNQYTATRQSLASRRREELAELGQQLLRQRTTQAIRGLLQGL
jgi:phosphotransferase system enzyme I (PtsP)